jgi:hypothetical protein
MTQIWGCFKEIEIELQRMKGAIEKYQEDLRNETNIF